MKTGVAGAYPTITPAPIDPAILAACDLNTEDGAVQRVGIAAAYKGSVVNVKRTMLKMNLEKVTAYLVIRSMCSPDLNSVLAADSDFLELKTIDLLELLEILKRSVTTKCDGHVEHDISDAMEAFFSL